jgi:hypothetical protein
MERRGMATLVARETIFLRAEQYPGIFFARPRGNQERARVENRNLLAFNVTTSTEPLVRSAACATAPVASSSCVHTAAVH